MADDAAFLSMMGEIQRELGGINEHLRGLDGKVSETLAQAKATNGRVNHHDREIAVLRSEMSGVSTLEKRLEQVEGRPRLYALGIGAPSLAALVVWALTHWL